MGDIIGNILGATIFIIFVWLIIAFISKLTGSTVSNRYGSGPIAKPNDLDDASDYIRKKIDPKYRRKKEYEKELEEALSDVNSEIIWIAVQEIKNNTDPRLQIRKNELYNVMRKITKTIQEKYPDVKFD